MSETPIKRPAIPATSGINDFESLRRFLEPVKTLIEIHEGWRGRPGIDRFVPEWELADRVNRVASRDVSDFIGNDTTAPGPPTSFLVAAGKWGNNILSWVNPADIDLYYVEVYVNTVNSIAAGDGAVRAGVVTTANRQGQAETFDHTPLNIFADHYYWIRSVDWSGNYSEWVGDVSGEGNGAVAPGIDTVGQVIDSVMDILKGGQPVYSAWDIATAYEAGNRVTHDGRTWECYEAVTGVSPIDNLDADPPLDVGDPTLGSTYWYRVGILIQGDVDGVPTVGIDGNAVIDGSLLARSISVDNLSAIVADLGRVTAGSIVIGDTNKIWLNDGGDGCLAIGESVDGKGNAAFRVSASGNLTIRGAIVQSPSGSQFPVPCFRGPFVYSASTTYYRGDVVTYGGSSWMFMNASPLTGTAAGYPQDNAYWDVYASAGVTQKTVVLTATALAFAYKTNGALQGPAYSDMTATATGVTGTLYYEFRVQGGTVQNTTNAIYRYYPPAAFSSLPQKVEVRVREGSASGTIVSEDMVSVIGLMAGTSTPFAQLTNGAHTIPSEADGTVSSYDQSGTGIMAWIGATQLNYNETGSPVANTFKVTAAGTNILPNSLPTTIGGNYRYYGNAKDMPKAALTATITFTVTITDANLTAIVIPLDQSLTKSIAGVSGSVGVSSRTVSLVASHMAAAFDTAGNLISPSEILLTATSLNTELTPYYQFFDVINGSPTSLGPPVTSPTKTFYMTGKTWAGMPRSIKVELREGAAGNPVLATDMISIVGLRAGSDAITTVLANASHTVPSGSDGAVTPVSGYVGSGSTLKVWDGTTALNYYTTTPSGAGFTVGTPTISPSDGITVGALSGNGTPTCTIGVHSGMPNSVDTVTITFPIIVKKQDLTTVTTSVVQTITKSKAGVSAKGLSLTATSQVFQVAKSGAVSPASITFTATGQSLTGSPSFSITGGTLGGSGATKTLAYSAMTADAATITVTWDSFTDTITVVKVREGSDAYTVVLTNETHNIACEADGDPVSGELGSGSPATTSVIVYKGAALLTGVSSTSPGSGKFYVGRTDVSCTSLKSGNDTVYLTAVTANSGRVDITVNCESQASIVKKFTWTKGKTGAAGAGTTYRGEWVTGRAYVGTAYVRDVVKNGTTYYICQSSHTSGTWATDLAAGKWVSFGATFASVATELLLADEVLTQALRFSGVGNSYLSIEGDAGLIIQSTGGMKVMDGADILMWGTSSNSSKIVFHASGGTLLNMACDYDNQQIAFWAGPTYGTGQIVFGWTDQGARQRLNGFGAAVDHGIWLDQDGTAAGGPGGRASLSIVDGDVALAASDDITLTASGDIKLTGTVQIPSTIEFTGTYGYINSVQAVSIFVDYGGVETGYSFTTTTFRHTRSSEDDVHLGNSTYLWVDVYAVNGTIQTSDKENKTSIAESDLGLDFINQLAPKKWVWKDGGVRPHYGLISQDVGAVLAERGQDFAGYIRAENVKVKGKDGHEKWAPKAEIAPDEDIIEEKEAFFIRYNEFIGPIIKAIQELDAKVNKMGGKGDAK